MGMRNLESEMLKKSLRSRRLSGKTFVDGRACFAEASQTNGAEVAEGVFKKMENRGWRMGEIGRRPEGLGCQSM